MNKIDKSLARLTTGQRDNMQINKTRNEKGDITTKLKKSKKSLDLTTKVYTEQNRKIWMKFF